MFRSLATLCCALALPQFAHTTVINLQFSVTPEIIGTFDGPTFFGHIVGEDINNDNYLLFDELTDFSLNWSGDALTPAWSHGLADIVAGEFLFTVARETYSLGGPGGPVGDLPGLFASSPGEPDVLRLTTSGIDGSNFRYSYGSDAVEWGLPRRVALRGPVEVSVPAPSVLGLSLVALLILVAGRSQTATKSVGQETLTIIATLFSDSAGNSCKSISARCNAWQSVR